MAQFTTVSGMRYFACEGCGQFFISSREFGQHRQSCSPYGAWTRGTQTLHPLAISGNPKMRHSGG